MPTASEVLAIPWVRPALAAAGALVGGVVIFVLLWIGLPSSITLRQQTVWKDEDKYAIVDPGSYYGVYFSNYNQRPCRMVLNVGARLVPAPPARLMRVD